MEIKSPLPTPTESGPSQKWMSIKYAALGFGAATALFVLVAAILGFWFHVPEDRKIAVAAADDYIRSMLAENRGIDVGSSDKNALKSWFNGKISFSPDVRSFDDKGFPLAGARLDFLNHQAVVALVYKRNQHLIDVFLYPDTENGHQGERHERGYSIFYWYKDGTQYWAVSDLGLPDLQQLAQLLKQ